MAKCPKCGHMGVMTETPWHIPYIYNRVDAQGGKIVVSCPGCGFQGLPAFYSGWPAANGHITTRSEAVDNAIRKFEAGKQRDHELTLP